MKSLRLSLTVILAATSAAAMATPAIKADFIATYKVAKGSNLDKAGCNVCHAGVPKLNAYGDDVKKALTAAKSKKLTADILKKVEKLDSNKDGKANGADIKADKLPGAAKGK